MAEQDLLRTDPVVLTTNASLRNSSEQLTPVPMISYSKKSRLNASKDVEAGTQPGSTTNNRKVLAHRKKLQEFYRLHAENQEEKKTEEVKEEASLSTIEKLQDPEVLDQFVKKAGAHEMLKIRNELALKLNFHDLEKKTIIYDNYSELIKLDQTLASVKQGTLTDEDRFLLLQGDQKKQTIVELLEETLASLKNEATVFNQDFRSVIDTVLLTSRQKET